jgi:hypothetical protein
MTLTQAVMTYLADCGGKCSQFDGSKGNVWVKIDQSGYDATEAIPWASKRLPTQNSTYTIKLPSKIAAGEYILRLAVLAVLWRTMVANPLHKQT